MTLKPLGALCVISRVRDYIIPRTMGYNKWLICLSHFLEHVTKVLQSFKYSSNTNMLYLFSLWQFQVAMLECSLVLNHYGV
jgi:hypothetical protein